MSSHFISKVNFNIILPFALRSCKCHLFLMFLDQSPERISPTLPLPQILHMFHLIYLNLIVPVTFSEELSS